LKSSYGAFGAGAGGLNKRTLGSNNLTSNTGKQSAYQGAGGGRQYPGDSSLGMKSGFAKPIPAASKDIRRKNKKGGRGGGLSNNPVGGGGTKSSRRNANAGMQSSMASGLIMSGSSGAGGLLGDELSLMRLHLGDASNPDLAGGAGPGGLGNLSSSADLLMHDRDNRVGAS